MLRIERRCSPMLIFRAWATCGFKKYPKNVALSFDVINKRPLRGGSRGRVHGVRTPPPWDDLRFSNKTGIVPKKKTMWLIGVEVEQETSAPPPKKKILDPPLPLHHVSIAHIDSAGTLFAVCQLANAAKGAKIFVKDSAVYFFVGYTYYYGHKK